MPFLNMKKKSIIHPDTGEKVAMPFRMSGFVPFNCPIMLGILMPNLSMAQVLFFQTINQTHCAFVNYANRNATKVNRIFSPFFNITIAVSTNETITELNSNI